MHPYAYLFGDLFFVLVWLCLFWLRKDLRKEMLAMSIVGACVAPLAFVFLLDYWSPEYIVGGFPIRIEDFLFAFSIGGIGGVLYEVLLRKVHAGVPQRSPRPIAGAVVAAIAAGAGLIWLFRVNSIYANYASFLILFGCMVMARRDLLPHAVLNGLFVALLMFIFYQVWIPFHPGIIQHWWKLQNISGVLIAGVPLEELVWGFTWGLAGGIMYEFIRGFRVKSFPRSE